MQSCYGIKPERLWQYYQDLQNLGAEPVDKSGETRALLFLSGLHYTRSYYKLATSGSEFETHYGPSHQLDDGLESVSRLTLKRVLRLARGKWGTEVAKVARRQGPIANEEWLRLRVAWIDTSEIERGTVGTWLERNGDEEGWLRLATAAGTNAPWEDTAVRFIVAMTGKPFTTLLNNASEDQHLALLECIKSFVRDHRIDIEEPEPPVIIPGELTSQE